MSGSPIQNELPVFAKFTKSGKPMPPQQCHTNEFLVFSKFTKYGNTWWNTAFQTVSSYIPGKQQFSAVGMPLLSLWDGNEPHVYLAIFSRLALIAEGNAITAMSHK